ncbi:MAG: type II secretion system GspH family protein [Pirellulales bacterium]|nr:type II secretion system GspH family protein [Pirellulales bacterium]
MPAVCGEARYKYLGICDCDRCLTREKKEMNAMRKSSTLKKKGLTLIELIVVLFILAAVAGISLTFIPGFQKLTHGSTSANAIRNGQTAVALKFIRDGSLGTEFDGLIGPGGGVPDYVANSDGLIPFPTTAEVLAALNDIGITEVHPATADSFADLLTAGGENATFDGHNYTALVDLTTGTPVIAQLAPAALPAATFNFNLDAGQFSNIFAFGIGEACSLVGTNGTFQEAPVHTPGEGSAVTSYGRYVVLVGYDATVGEEEATYLGITCIDDGENFNNINRNIGEYLEAAGG